MENTKIEWADHTFNPWIGCAKVSAGCTNCYAETLMDKRYGRVVWGKNGTRVRTSKGYWKQPYLWNKKAKMNGGARRVFCASLADVFEDRIELNEWRIDLWHLISNTPDLIWLLLTKRPENVKIMWPSALQKNVWIGTSVENQDAVQRINHLTQISTTRRFLSVEPLLSPVEIPIDGIDWVIVGGESGHNARPVHVDWVRRIRDKCQQNNVSFFFKQWGEWLPGDQVSTLPKYSQTHVFDDGLVTYRVGKTHAGRRLDGREWNEIPE